MSLPAPYQEHYYIGDGTTVTFPFGSDFKALAEANVKCIIYFDDGTNCVPTFTVNMAAGSITIVTLTKPDGTVLTVPPVGSVVRVFRETPEQQNVTASQLQNYTAKQLEKIFDSIVAMIQENGYTAEHKTIRLTETQRDVSLQNMSEDEDQCLLYWDEESGTIKSTSYTHTGIKADVERANEVADQAKSIAQTTQGNLATHIGDANNPHLTSIEKLTDTSISEPTNNDILRFNGHTWVNSSSDVHVEWGEIEGTLSDQTDLQNALDAKVNLDGSSIMTGPLKMAAGSMRGAVSPFLNGVGFFKMDSQYNLTNIANLSDTQFYPVTTGGISLGTSSYKWKDLYLAGDEYLDNGKRIRFAGTASNRYFNIETNQDEIRFIHKYGSYDASLSFRAYTGDVVLYPHNDGKALFGLPVRRWQRVYTTNLCSDTNGANLISVPNKAGTIALMSDVEQAANSGSQLYTTGVWYAKMYAATTVPTGAEYDGKNYADFSQVDGDNNPIIVIYEGQSGAWVQVETITPPSTYNGYITVTSKIWDIVEQTDQQGGQVLWSFSQQTFTPYPRIVSVDGLANTDLNNLTTTGKANVSALGTYDSSETYNAGTVGEAIKSKANDTDVVHKTGNESIAGNKTFTSTTTVNYLTVNPLTDSPTSLEGGEIKFVGASGEVNAGKAIFIDRYDGVLRFFGYDSSGTVRVPLRADVEHNRAYCVTPTENTTSSVQIDTVGARNTNIRDFAYKHITNCITEIPQDIKLELNAGILTLKAGSKVYIPNGSGIFDVLSITNDIHVAQTMNGNHLVYVNTGQALWAKKESGFVSGDTTPPAIGDGIWYNTTANRIEWYTGTGWSGNGGRSFPIARVTVSNGAISSIDQVFNGFGYIGSTVFALPGVKGLIPNGRNADGTLKDTTFALSSVKTQTSTLTVSNTTARIYADGTVYWGSISDVYNPDTNYNMVGTTIDNACVFAYITSTTGGKITSFNSKQVFHAVDYSDFNLGGLTDTNISSVSNGQVLMYDSSIGKWKNSTTTVTVVWGGIGGTLSDQTDLKNALDAKADIDLSNAANNVDFVVESQEPNAGNDYTWYRKYKSGWVEQGGSFATVYNDYHDESVVLPLAMSNSNYTCLISISSGGNARYSAQVDSKTTTGFTVHHLTNITAYAAGWQVSGKAA